MRTVEETERKESIYSGACVGRGQTAKVVIQMYRFKAERDLRALAGLLLATFVGRRAEARSLTVGGAIAATVIGTVAARDGTGARS